jgi:hypothetical protein
MFSGEVWFPCADIGVSMKSGMLASVSPSASASPGEGASAESLLRRVPDPQCASGQHHVG